MTTPPYADLDPGIREVVRWVNSLGFETSDSGDGVSKGPADDCVTPYPHVHIPIHDTGAAIRCADALYAAATARGFALPPEQGPLVQLSYDPGDGLCVISLYGVNDTMLAAVSR